MKGSVCSKLVSTCSPSSDAGENRHLRVGRLAYLLGFFYKLLLLNLKWISEAPKDTVNYKSKLFGIWDWGLTLFILDLKQV